MIREDVERIPFRLKDLLSTIQDKNIDLIIVLPSGDEINYREAEQYRNYYVVDIAPKFNENSNLYLYVGISKDIEIVYTQIPENSDKIENEKKEITDNQNECVSTIWEYSKAEEQFLDNKTGLNPSFMVGDAFWVLKEMGIEANILEIDNVYVKPDDRRNGIGSDLVNKEMNGYKDHLILAASAATKQEFPEEPSPETIQNHIDDLHSFWTKLQFEDINTLLVNYESKRAYVFVGNEIGKKFYEHLLSEEK